MKPKLNKENKAKIFGLYTGQEVLRNHACNDIEIINGLQLDNVLSTDFLELRPLSSITDEEILSIYPRYKKEQRGIYIDEIISDFRLLTDQLRLMGFAVSWCGWSVEELVKEGVFKLKE